VVVESRVRWRGLSGSLMVVLVVAASAPSHAVDIDPAGASVAATVRVSVSTGGGQANGSSGASKVSANCRVVTFASRASNLVRGDTKRRADVFAHNVTTDGTILVSRALAGERADGDSRPNGISASGRFIAYDSGASNLVHHDDNDQYDVFVRDTMKLKSERISVPADGGWADGPSYRPAISANGRFVAFDSYATNMVADDQSGGFDVFVRDRQMGTTERISIGLGDIEPDGESTGAAISANGRFVVFESGADNLVDNDGNGFVDVFLYDRKVATTSLVSLGSGGESANELSVNADISANGRYIAFTSKATNLVQDDTNGSISDVFVRDRIAGTTQIVSVTSGGVQTMDEGSLQGTLSADGSVVTFDSFSSGMVGGDTNLDPDVFVHFTDSGITRRASVSDGRRQGNLGSVASAIADGGDCVSFTTGASNLVKHDTNNTSDIMLRTLVS
jgi:hypothetical protein